MSWPQEFTWNSTGPVLKTSGFIPTEPILFLLLRDDLLAIADTLVVFLEEDPETMSCIFCTTSLTDFGVVAARGDTIYQVSLLDSIGRAQRIWSRSDLPAANRSSAELERLDAASNRLRGTEGGGGRTAFSQFKPRFPPKSISADSDGRLWLAPSANDGEAGALDVFAESGELLATLETDHPVLSIKIRHGYLLIGSESDLGEPIVQVYRIRD